jgi:hypothetical protein
VPILAALLLSAAAAFFVQPRVIEAVRADRLEASWLLAAPALFALVTVLAALDAFRIARRRGYFRGPSVVALAACVAFLGLLVPNTFAEYRARTSPPAASTALYADLLQSRDPRVRALVMEVAGLRGGESSAVADLLQQGLDDSDPLVVGAAVSAVEHRAGVPLEGATAATRAAEIVKTWRRGN